MVNTPDISRGNLGSLELVKYDTKPSFYNIHLIIFYYVQEDAK